MSYCTRFKDSSHTIDETKPLHTDEETAIVYQQFIESFEEPGTVHKTWVKGGTVNPGSSTYISDSSGTLYQPHKKPLDKTPQKSSSSDKIQFEINKKPPFLGKVKEQNKKKSNLELLCDELKQNQQDQEMRLMKRRRQSGLESDTTRSKFKESTPGGEGRPYDDHRKSRTDSSLDQSSSKSQHLLSSVSTGGTIVSSNDLDSAIDSENDRSTTNLYLGNLNPELTEKQLCELFGRFGALASVKIMWPRNSEEKARTRNFGFVAYMNRVDCERAFVKLNGVKVCGYEMKLGWGKTISIPSFPVYIPPLLMDRIRSPPPSGLPFNAQPRRWLDGPITSSSLSTKTTVSTTPPGNGAQDEVLEDARFNQRMVFDMFSMSDDELAELLRHCVVKVTIPTDRPLLQLINRTVEFVVREGVEFEAFIMNKEMRNPNFKFLFDFQSPEHVYYRWKLYSILHGESVKHWKTDEFLMYVDGPFWRPPPLNPFTSGLPEELIDDDIDFSKLTLENISQSVTSTAELSKESNHHHNQSGDVCMENPYNSNTAATAAATGGSGLVDSSHGGGGHHQQQSQQPNMYKRQLTTHQRERFLQVLTELDPSKGSVGEAMVWCLEHADSAEDVLDLIVKQIEKMASTTTISSSVDNSTGGESGTTTNNGSNGLNQIVALLFLVSDILHNSCAKVRNASFYRKYIENSLPQLMTFFNQYYLSLTSKVKSEQLKHKVLSCFRAWSDWYVYPFEFLQRLRNQFLGIEEPPTNDTEKVDRKIAEENLIGSCQPLVDYDGDPLDVDGVPLDNNSTVAVASNTIQGNVGMAGNSAIPPVADLSNSVDEMLDMFANPSSPERKSSSGGRATTMFVPSKWETVDPADEESDMVQSRWQLLEEEQHQQRQRQLEHEGDDDEEDDMDGYPLSDSERMTVAVVAADSSKSEHHRSRQIQNSQNDGGRSLVSYSLAESDDSSLSSFGDGHDRDHEKRITGRRVGGEKEGEKEKAFFVDRRGRSTDHDHRTAITTSYNTSKSLRRNRYHHNSDEFEEDGNSSSPSPTSDRKSKKRKDQNRDVDEDNDRSLRDSRQRYHHHQYEQHIGSSSSSNHRTTTKRRRSRSRSKSPRSSVDTGRSNSRSRTRSQRSSHHRTRPVVSSNR